MTECPNAEMRDRLPDLANDSLSPALRIAVVSHVTQCTACTAELELLRLARSVVIGATPRVDVAGIVSALPRAAAGQIRADHRSRGRSWSSWRIAAAVTVLAAGAGSFAVMQQRSSGVRPADSLAAGPAAADSGAGLALAGSLADLSDAELQSLVDGLGSIEALPAPDVEAEMARPPVPDADIMPDSVLRDLEGI